MKLFHNAVRCFIQAMVPEKWFIYSLASWCLALKWEGMNSSLLHKHTHTQARARITYPRRRIHLLPVRFRSHLVCRFASSTFSLAARSWRRSVCVCVKEKRRTSRGWPSISARCTIARSPAQCRQKPRATSETFGPRCKVKFIAQSCVSHLALESGSWF